MTRMSPFSAIVLSLGSLNLSACQANFSIGYKDTTSPLSRILASVKPATTSTTANGATNSGTTSASLVDQTDDDNSATGFGGGTTQGVLWDGSKVTLDSANTGPSELAASWTPQFASIVGYWKMEGDWNDATANANNGAAQNGAALSSIAHVGSQSTLFDGNDDRISIPYAANLDISGSVSVAAWVKLASGADGTGAIFEKTIAGNQNQQFLLFYEGSAVKFRINNGGIVDVSADSTLTPNVWVHAVAVWNGATTKLYIDGNPQSGAGAAGGAMNTGNGISIIGGLGSAPHTYHWNGNIDEVAVWNSALTAAEVKTIFEKQSDKYKNYSELDSSWAPQWASLIHYWKLNGDWSDAIGGVIGTPAGTPFFSDAAKVGSHSAVFTTTSSDTVTLGAIAVPLTSGTYSVWINPNNLITDNQGIIDTGDSFDVFQWGGSLYFRPGNPGLQQQVAISWTPRTWHHVVMTWDGTNFFGYLDGIQVATGASTESLSANLSLAQVDNTNYFNGKMDDFALWSSALTAAEVKTIYDRQASKYSGSLSSRAMDATASATWADLTWKTTLPFFKELPDGGISNTESSTSHSSLVGSTGSTSDNNLLSGLVGLWHLNEATWAGIAGELRDTSGNANHGVRVGGTATTSSSGSFGRAGSFYGASYLDAGNDATLQISGDITVQSWVRTTMTAYGIITTKYSGGVSGFLLQISGYTTGKASIDGRDTGGYRSSGESTTGINDGRWHHVVGQRSGSTWKIYVDGVLENQNDVGNATSIANLIGTLNIGGLGASNLYTGAIDEVAIWNRALHDSEIMQLYRRGANRLKFQMRSCATNPCTVESWLGPDGTNQTYFSELNNTSIPAGGGLVLPTLPDVFFSAFGGLTVPNNRYFQYRAIFESDDSSVAVSPDLQSLRVGPTR